ncbi:MAG: type II toxin-antitoxin system VapC family toxin [Heteroscytonema crispum UTEX LB 1556]
MSLWILDTDSLSLFQRGHPSLTQRVSAITPEEIAITIITVEEQMYGRLNRIRKANSQDALVLAYTSLGETLDDLKSINIVEFDQNAANCYAQLQRQKIRIGTQDLRIAAITLSVNGILVTRNRKDFAKVPNLQLEDWTID